MKTDDLSSSPSPDDLYRELVVSLYTTRMPTIIMGALFLMTTCVVYSRTDDLLIRLLMPAGVIASAIRIVVVWRDTAKARQSVSAAETRRMARRLAICYWSFATINGLFAARVFMIASPELQVLAGVTVIGYCAGVAATAASRPWICVPTLLAASLPLAVVCFLSANLVSIAVAITVLGLLAGGLRNTLERYRAMSADIARRLQFANLARKDQLTRLANRLGLLERFEDLAKSETCDCAVGVHCLDLDFFKEINDAFGHAGGDAVLCHVADRLSANAGKQHIAARLGGDEFVFVQVAGVRDASDIGAMRRRLEMDVNGEYVIAGQPIAVHVSVGSVMGDPSIDALANLIEQADRELMDRKRERFGDAACRRAPGRAGHFADHVGPPSMS